MLESEAKDNSSRSRLRPRTKFWPRGQLDLEDLTSLVRPPTFDALQTHNLTYLSGHCISHGARQFFSETETLAKNRCGDETRQDVYDLVETTRLET